MRVRLLPLLTCLLLCPALMVEAQAASLAQQRQMYDEAKRALAKGNRAPYQLFEGALRNYPLEPYLAYDELTGRLKQASNEEIEKFLAEHGDLPQIGWMKLRWLRWLTERGEWSTFADYYDPALNFTELDCLYGQYLFRANLPVEANAQAQKLWLVGKSQPEACDALFSQWQRSGGLTDELRWQRAKLAAEAGQYGLASSLIRQLPGLTHKGQLLVEVAQKPQLLKQTGKFVPADRQMADVVGLGLRRMARQNPEQAIEWLEFYGNRLPFSSEEKVAIARSIGLTLAKRFDARALKVMAQYDPELRDNTVSEWRTRLLLRLGRWNEAHELTLKLPQELASTPRWRYWQARSLQLAQPQNPQVPLLYAPVANERDIYGFMAADQVKQSYQLNNRPLALDPKVMQKVRNTAGVRRAMEFHDRGQIVDGRREWYHVSRLFSREELVAQARVAYEKQWYFPAIRTISQAQYWDDLDIRFPMAYQSTLTREARNRNLHSSWVFAITRQESAFMVDAKSPVGATGLMQLMPATAKETAKRYGIALSSPQQLINPNVNIQLGAAYLSQLYNQFKGNRVLASASYNAGAGNVRKWLKNADHLPADVWMETIPFDETRQYVHNVLAYSVIYGKKLDAPVPVLEWHEKFFDDQ
ncbi:MAG TPA: transglycosylase SLT domain-containing protein [Pseudomonas sp.]|nr:transglycosylase SLT domain-containing protein [Pseudomonas sp.]